MFRYTKSAVYAMERYGRALQRYHNRRTYNPYTYKKGTMRKRGSYSLRPIARARYGRGRAGARRPAYRRYRR